MSMKDELEAVERKLKQAEHRRNLEKNRQKAETAKKELRAEINIGKLFVKYMPLGVNDIADLSKEDVKEKVEEFMKRLGECIESYQKIEEAVMDEI